MERATVQVASVLHKYSGEWLGDPNQVLPPGPDAVPSREPEEDVRSHMKILIAEDDRLFQQVLLQVLTPEFEVVVANDGAEAWRILQAPDAPRLAILDWVMPGLTGPEICRMVRADASLQSTYLIILTSKNSEADVVAGLRAGADDYITKPPNATELCARTRIGSRILSLQDALIGESQPLNERQRERKGMSEAAISYPRKKAARPEMVCSPDRVWRDSRGLLESGSELTMDTGIATNRLPFCAEEIRHAKG